MNATEIKSIIEEKVSGKILPEHSQYGHHYRFIGSGKLMDSVTGILGKLKKEHLERYMVKKGIEWLEIEERFLRLKDPAYRNDYINAACIAYTEFRDDAGSVGTDAHEAIEVYIKEWIAAGKKPEDIKDKRFWEKPNTDPRSIASARSIEKLFQEAGEDLIPLASEILVGDERYSAGTLDFLCLYKGEIELWDFKTSNQVNDDYAMQTAAYGGFFTGMTGLKIKRIKILHVSKDMDKFTTYLVPKPNEAFAAFKGLCATYKWTKNRKEKLVKDIKRVKI